MPSTVETRLTEGVAMPRLDRAEILGRTDLHVLATELCGEPKGGPQRPRWHCPDPRHPDRNPSMTTFRDRAGTPRWRCHACGEGGTAVDLLMVATGATAGDALRELAARSGLAATGPASTATARRSRTVAPGVADPAPAARPDPWLEEFVTTAADLLWTPPGDFALRRLAERGFSEPLLRANRIGFDPGPGMLPRPDGHPRSGPGIVFPVLHPDSGVPIYYQRRTLSPHRAADRKYDQPTAAVAPNPRLARVHPVNPAHAEVLAICEGFPDALTAAQAGTFSLAVLGVGLASSDGAPALISQILRDHDFPAYAVCLDNDAPALAAATRLAHHLAGHGRAVARLLPPTGRKDLNEWWRADPEAVRFQFTGARDLLIPQPSQALQAALPPLTRT
jgi:DNA primase